jgi:hypothetical protein
MPLGLDDLDGDNNGNGYECNHGNHEQEDGNFRLKKFKRILMRMQMNPFATMSMSMILVKHLTTMWRMWHIKILPIQG